MVQNRNQDEKTIRTTWMSLGIVINAPDCNAHERWQHLPVQDKSKKFQHEPAEGVSALFDFKCYIAFFLGVQALCS